MGLSAGDCAQCIYCIHVMENHMEKTTATTGTSLFGFFRLYGGVYIHLYMYISVYIYIHVYTSLTISIYIK